MIQHSGIIAAFLAAASAGVGEEFYREKFRPQFHFTPATNWMNDPNGMVFYDGEYHLFYQYNPFGIKWGHMSWGHAISRDLAHWEHLPVALYEENDVMIFSGSAVVDWKNTSGFGRNGKPPLIAIYTGHYTKKPLQNQHIAFSNDRGRTWTKYPGNPVLDIGAKDFRDPKVIWHEGTGRWVMTVAWPVERQVRFYASPNLKEWTHLSDFGPAGSVKGIWECPDLFPLDGKWVLIVNVGSGAPAGGSGCQYFIGDFDGKRFRLDPSYPQPQPEHVPAGKVLADFEGEDYGGWRVSGAALGRGPARGKIGSQQPVDGFRGRGLVNTFHDGDKSEGTLTSPEFDISGDHLSFLIGGGNHAGKTCMNLVADGRVVRTATGDAAERLAWKSWDVRDLRGKRAVLEIVDRHTGGWGHINIDHILLAEQPARAANQPALWADFGPDFYAAVSWSDIPRRDGRRLWLGWMSNWQYANDVPTAPWRSAMSLPRELTLRNARDGMRLVQQPARELRKLRAETYRLRSASLADANDWFRRQTIGGALWEIEAEMEARAEFGFKVLQMSNQATLIRCDPKQKMLSLDRTQSGRTDFHAKFPGTYQAPLAAAEVVRLRLFIDASSVEIFADGGASVITALVLPEGSSSPIQLWSADDSFSVRRLAAWKLKGAVPIISRLR